MVYSDNEHLHPYGTELDFSVDDITYTPVNDLQSVEGPGVAWTKSDDTTLQTANRLKISTPGLQEVNQLKFVTYGHKTQGWGTIMTNFYGRATYYWKVTFPKLSAETTASNWKAQGYLVECKPFGKVEKGSDEKIAIEFTVELITKPIFTAGS